MEALSKEPEARPVQVLEERPVAARRAVTALFFVNAPCDLGFAYPRHRGIAWPQPRNVRTRLAGCGSGRFLNAEPPVSFVTKAVRNKTLLLSGIYRKESYL
jgi:hypothetical protein